MSCDRSAARGAMSAARLAAAAALVFVVSWEGTPDTARAQEAAGAERPVFDPGAAPRTRIPLAPGLDLGVRAEFEYQLEKDFDLNEAAPDDLWFAEPLLRVALSYRPTPRYTLFLDFETARRWVDDDERKSNDESRLELKQAYLSVNEPVKGLTLQMGRVRYKDRREWLYDEELDGGRLFYAFSRYSIEASVTQKNDRDFLHGGGDERITNFVLYGRWAPARDIEVAAYGFIRDDRSSADESPWFIGVHSGGEPLNDLEYWVEAALVRGRSGGRDIEGAGFDVGATYEFDLAIRPSVTLAYAFGSGDSDPADGKDRNFRQTGFQENEAKISGLRRVKYYGELLDPELSNLHILTASAGIRPRRDLSVEILFHRYRQDKASRLLRVGSGSPRDTTELDEDPNGADRDLGREYDLVAAYRPLDRLNAKLVLGLFDPGDAFGRNADRARFAEFEVTYEF